jgi:hypothetical protein
MVAPTCDVTVLVTSPPTALEAASAVAIASTAHRTIVLEQRRAQDEAREPRVDDLEVAEDPRDHGDRRDGDRDREDEQHGRVVAGGPASRSSGRNDPTTSATTKGSDIPIPRIHAIGRRFSAPSTRRTSLPATNTSSTPSQYVKLRTMRVASPSPVSVPSSAADASRGQPAERGRADEGRRPGSRRPAAAAAAARRGGRAGGPRPG